MKRSSRLEPTVLQLHKSAVAAARAVRPRSIAGAEYEVALIPKIKVEKVVAAAALKGALAAIHEAACTGRISDGKVFVLDTRSAMGIRTGETGLAAL